MKTNREELYKFWKQEESIAHIHGWDFSHIQGRYEVENDLPWDYDTIVRSYLSDNAQIMDFDTGGAEYLLSLGHPYELTAATEGYPPNVELCKERLLPLGIDFRPCDDATDIPFDDNSFDVMINRHGDFDPNEIARLLKTSGVFITEQVGAKNDRDLVKFVLPDFEEPFPHLILDIQRKAFEEAGFELIRAEECFRPIKFYDVGAFVWFAHIIEWEFPDFSVDKCLDRLYKMQEIIDRDGVFIGTAHRFLIVVRKR